MSESKTIVETVQDVATRLLVPELAPVKAQIEALSVQVVSGFHHQEQLFNEKMASQRAEFNEKLGSHRAEFNEKFTGLRLEFNERFTGLSSEFNDKFTGLRSEFVGLRSEFVELRSEFAEFRQILFRIEEKIDTQARLARLEERLSTFEKNRVA